MSFTYCHLHPVAYSNILLSTAVVLLATVGLCVPPFLSDPESGVPELVPIESSHLGPR